LGARGSNSISVLLTITKKTDDSQHALRGVLGTSDAHEKWRQLGFFGHSREEGAYGASLLLEGASLNEDDTRAKIV
jgi:hypothetical protein